MLRLDENKLYYLDRADGRPPVTYTLGEIVSMMEQNDKLRAGDVNLRRGLPHRTMHDRRTGTTPYARRLAS